MDIRDELRAILRAAGTANDNQTQRALSDRVEHTHSGRIELVVTGLGGGWLFPPVSLPDFAPVGRSNVKPAHPARLVLNPAPWVRQQVARDCD